jgi:hypothetical protein
VPPSRPVRGGVGLWWGQDARCAPVPPRAWGCGVGGAPVALVGVGGLLPGLLGGSSIVSRVVEYTGPITS